MKEKRARARRWLAAALGAALLSSAARAAEPGLLRQLAGRWIRKDCLAGLRATRSPMASGCGGFNYLFIDEQGWKAGYNFHETGEAHAVETISLDEERTNLYVLKEHTGPESVGTQFVRVIRRQAGAPAEIQWLERGGAQGPLFVRAEEGDFALQANRLALAGDYVDERGQPFRFTPASRAEWPGQAFAYKLGLDFVEGPDCDYLEVADQRTPEGFALRYGFRRDHGTLLIYKMIETKDEDRCDAKPLRVLTPR